jgi:hypothetical protein
MCKGFIRCGELLLSLVFELSLSNDGKVERPFKLTDSYVMLIAVACYLLSMPYKQIEGFTRALHRLIPKLLPVDYAR